MSGALKPIELDKSSSSSSSGKHSSQQIGAEFRARLAEMGV
jgi:hypothetical protein